MRKSLTVLVLFLGSIVVFSSSTHAQLNGIAICTNTSAQTNAVIVSDGAGGAIIAWSDQRSDASDIYAQRVNAGGNPLWTPDGVQVAKVGAFSELDPKIISDGAGGAIIAWDTASSGPNIYVQRIDATGTPLWPKIMEGVALTNSGSAEAPDLTSDGAGGAIVTWNDFRDINTGLNIYACRVNSSGAVQWTAGGVAICTAFNDQNVPGIVPDGAGGAIITWTDQRTGFDVYAQRVNASGATQWTGNGVLLGATVQFSVLAPLVADGAGGAIATWVTDPVNFDIAAQRVNAAGAAQWGGGVLVCAAANRQASPRITSDGAAGAIITWEDARTGIHRDLYAQHLNASGAPQWTLNGKALTSLTSGTVNSELYPVVAANGAGGEIVAWQDYRGGAGNNDIYARAISASGSLGWPANGTPICTAAGYQLTPKVETDGTTAIVTWVDARTFDYDIYVEPISVVTGVHDAPSISVLSLTPNHPNPFLDGTTMNLNLPGQGDVKIEVFDVAGHRVRHTDLGQMDRGWREITFDGHDDAGRLLPSGVYFYRVHAGAETVTKKMVIAK